MSNTDQPTGDSKQEECKHEKYIGGVCVKCDYVAFSSQSPWSTEEVRKHSYASVIMPNKKDEKTK